MQPKLDIGRVGVCLFTAKKPAQVSRTDANALIALDPVDLTVTRKFNYTSILPEAKVSTLCFMRLLFLPVLAMLCGHCNAAACTFS